MKMMVLSYTRENIKITKTNLSKNILGDLLIRFFAYSLINTTLVFV